MNIKKCYNFQFNILQKLLASSSSSQHSIMLNKNNERHVLPSFGFFFDIDGVFMLGKKVIPEAKAAVHDFLIDDRGNWRIPTVFVTNAGNSLKARKAEMLSELFEAKVTPDQVIMSHSPLRMFTQFHKQRVLICGQGPLKTIARHLGFTDVITVDELHNQYPQLDVCDHNRRKSPPCAFEFANKPIEAVVLLGEPINWERSLQLVLDVLISNGQPYAHHVNAERSAGDDLTERMRNRKQLSSSHDLNGMPKSKIRNTLGEKAGNNEVDSVSSFPHIPVLACNMDLTWMAEAPLPRMAHGSFLVCLESLFEKITGHRLLYTALVGKPCEITYHYSEWRLNHFAYQMRLRNAPNVSYEFQTPIQTLYCIGDNPQTDIYGANLYNKFLSASRSQIKQTYQWSLQGSNGSDGEMYNFWQEFREECEAAINNGGEPVYGKKQWMRYLSNYGLARQCLSYLVCTGVCPKQLSHQGSHDEVGKGNILDVDDDALRNFLERADINHQHRDFPNYPDMKMPKAVQKNVYSAIHDILVNEKFPLQGNNTSFVNL